MTHLAGEDEVLQLIRSMLGNGIGTFGLRDDAAVLDVSRLGSLVVSVDSVVEGVHVDLSLCSPGDVGWKSLMGALSDLAAVGATPVGGLVALCVPDGSDGSGGSGELALGVMGGVAEASAASGCPVVGGDLSGAGQLAVSVTVLGTIEPGDHPAVSRAGAKPGDVVLVTGPCGASAAGLRELRADNVAAGADRGGLAQAYRRPVARLREGELARVAGAHAMIDVSDGLALDLHRMADASGVGFELDAVPVAEGATEDEAVGGGEDYELLVAIGATEADALIDRFTSSEGLRRPIVIGTVVQDATVRTLRGQPLERLGWQHRVG
jgi:thiamine-monophosphate kinase